MEAVMGALFGGRRPRDSDEAVEALIKAASQPRVQTTVLKADTRASSLSRAVTADPEQQHHRHISGTAAAPQARGSAAGAGPSVVSC